jgi:hypothetical protein
VDRDVQFLTELRDGGQLFLRILDPSITITEPAEFLGEFVLPGLACGLDGHLEVAPTWVDGFMENDVGIEALFEFAEEVTEIPAVLRGIGGRHGDVDGDAGVADPFKGVEAGGWCRGARFDRTNGLVVQARDRRADSDETVGGFEDIEIANYCRAPGEDSDRLPVVDQLDDAAAGDLGGATVLIAVGPAGDHYDAPTVLGFFPGPFSIELAAEALGEIVAVEEIAAPLLLAVFDADAIIEHLASCFDVWRTGDVAKLAAVCTTGGDVDDVVAEVLVMESRLREDGFGRVRGLRYRIPIVRGNLSCTTPAQQLSV